MGWRDEKRDKKEVMEGKSVKAGKFESGTAKHNNRGRQVPGGYAGDKGVVGGGRRLVQADPC